MARLRGMRVVVAGAGALGLTTALTLARAGAVVTVVDPAAPGANASGVAAGMLAPVFESVLEPEAEDRPALLIAARDRWPTLAASIGLALDRAGAVAAGSPEEVREWRPRLETLGVAWSPLTASDVQARAPGVREGWVGLYTPGDWRLDPGQATAALRRAIEGAGGRLVADVVQAFEAGQVRLGQGESLAADTLVIATGASRSLVALAPELGALSPIKGHILTAPDVASAGPVLRFAGVYVCPGLSGAVIGATMEAGRSDADVDPEVAAGLLAQAVAAVPALAGVRTVARTGVRAATPDGLPLVGPSGAPGVWLAAGARRNGWLLAPLIAETVARGLAGETPPPAAFAPGRFG